MTEFTVAELLRTELLKNAKLLGGKEGLGRRILSGTIIEAPDIVRFINGGEVLLTGLFAFQSCTLSVFKEYIYQLLKKNVSALLIKRGRNVNFAKEKITFLAEFAELYGIPVVEIPFEVSFRDVLSLIMERLFNEEVTRLKYFKAAHDNFAALPFAADSAEDGIGKILSMLEQMVENGAGVFNQHLECLAATEGELSEFCLEKKAERVDPGLYSIGSYFRQEKRGEGKYGGRMQTAVQFDIMPEVRLYLVVTETKRPVNDMDYIAMESALTALRYEVFRQYSLEELEKKYENDLISNLLSGKIRTRAELEKSKTAKILDMPADGNYRVVVFSRDGDRGEERLGEAVRRMGALERAVRKVFPGSRLNQDVGLLAAIQTVEGGENTRDGKERFRRDVDRVQKLLAEMDPGVRVRAGVGKTVESLLELSDSFHEAKDALLFLDVSPELSEEEASRTVFFSELGIFSLLCRIRDSRELMQYVPESLQKLYQYRKPQRDDLIHTLKVYLERNKNLTRTAEDLYIHYKTAAYRLRKISDITGIDFENPSELLAVRIGLVIYQMIEREER